MKKVLSLLVAVIAMSMAFVSCEKDENSGGKNYNDYLEFLLGLPEGLSEEAGNLYVKNVEEVEDFEIVTVLTLTFEKEICVKAICDYVYPTEEMAKLAYEMWLQSWEEMSDVEKSDASYKKRIFTIDFSETPDMFVGLTREEISATQGIF